MTEAEAALRTAVIAAIVSVIGMIFSWLSSRSANQANKKIKDSEIQANREIQEKQEKHNLLLSQQTIDANNDIQKKQEIANKEAADREEKHKESMKDLENEFALKLQKLASEYQDDLSEKNARREYNCEARKRLYEELYPLLFEIAEASESATSRIRNLAKRYQSNPKQLCEELSHLQDHYYLRSTIHRLFIPVAQFRLMQRRLTHVDLSLDSRLHRVYKLLQALFRTFGDDREIAHLTGLEYKPHSDSDSDDRRNEPKIHYPQGLLRGELECIGENLITQDGDSTQRCITYGDFNKKWSQGGDWRRSFNEAIELLAGFTPDGRPVLWTALKAQFMLHRAIVVASTDQNQLPTIEFFDNQDAAIFACTDFDKDHSLTYHYLKHSKVSNMLAIADKSENLSTNVIVY